MLTFDSGLLWSGQLILIALDKSTWDITKGHKMARQSRFTGVPEPSVGRLRNYAAKKKMNMKCLLLVLKAGSVSF